MVSILRENDDGFERVTFTDPIPPEIPSVTSLVAVVKLIVGAASLSVIVNVWVICPPNDALIDGLNKSRVMVSSISSLRSLLIGIEIDTVVVLALKISVESDKL